MSSGNSRYGKHYQPLARNMLVADREHRPVPQGKIEASSFGIYRPASAESLPKLERLANDVADFVGDITLRNTVMAAPMRVNEKFGVTLVKERRVRTKIGDALRAGFEIGSACRNVYGCCEGESELKVDHIEWLREARYKSYDARHLVLRFERDDAYDELVEQYEEVRMSLAKVGLYDVVPEEVVPHITLIKYGHQNDGMRLNRKMMNRIEGALQPKLDKHRLHAVRLGRLVMGPTYDIEHPVASNQRYQPALVR